MKESTQTLTDWQMKRKGRFTASEIHKLFVEPRTQKDRDAGLLSETAKGYIFEKAVEYMTGYRKGIFPTKPMQHGIHNEFEGFEAFNKAIGLNFELTSNQFYPLGDNAGASPDGILPDGIDVLAVVDIKCPYEPTTFFEQKLMLSSVEDIPKIYYYQLQMQMLCTGAPTSYLARYLTSNNVDQYGNKLEYSIPEEKRIFWTQLDRNEEVHQQILDKISLAENVRQEFINQLIK
jgi:hypothetical protein